MVQLIPMTESEFQSYLEGAIKDYAEDKVKAGNWLPEEALLKSTEVFSSLLPQGVSSEGQYLFSIRESSTDPYLGMIWFAVNEQAQQRSAFICNFSVLEAFRGIGYGKAALVALEDKIRELEITTISLHVFGHNKTALALYQKMGYETTNINMSKCLADGG